MPKGITTDFFKQLDEALRDKDSLSKENKELKDKNKSLEEEKEKLKRENEKLKKENERLKMARQKDSSNSSKPSSTNGYKNVITNRRDKSNLKQGGQPNHKYHCLDEGKIQELIDKGATVEIIEVNKNKSNATCEYKTMKIIDIEFKTVIKEYRYYPDEAGNYEIPSNEIQNIVYGDTIKGFASCLMHHLPNSTDSVKEIISSITNEGIELSKGTLINWTGTLAVELQPEIENIEEKLLDSHYLNCDEINIKIDGEDSNILCCSNSTHTRFWVSESKTSEAIEAIGFLLLFMGVIVKDGTDIYNNFGTAFSQCLSHILRYLKGLYDFINHKGPKEMAEFIKKCIDLRENLIKKGKTQFDKKTYSKLLEEYDKIIKSWKWEWMHDTENVLYEEERKLLSRLEDSDKEQVLYFLKDFRIPTTNNQAEADQRPIKIKQKIGKFRSEEGADNHTIIRSCINTYKKNGINVLKALSTAFAGEPIIV